MTFSKFFAIITLVWWQFQNIVYKDVKREVVGVKSNHTFLEVIFSDSYNIYAFFAQNRFSYLPIYDIMHLF